MAETRRPSRPALLSPRQRSCLQLVALGLSSVEIAAKLGISARTCDQHISDACERLRVRKRVQAVARAVELGLISGALRELDDPQS